MGEEAKHHEVFECTVRLVEQQIMTAWVPDSEDDTKE
jgi:hypothetical protein